MQGTRLAILIILLGSFITTSYGKEVSIAGVYKGKPLFIQNPYHPGLNSFCIDEIYINKRRIDIDYTLSAIQIKFEGFDLYTPVNIKILHKDVCKPIIVNPEAILFHSSFKFTEIAVNDTVLHWHTKGDRPNAIFKVEKLFANGWESIETKQSTGQFEGDEYVYYPEFEEGPNKFRVKYEVRPNRYLYSREVEIEYYPEPIELLTTQVSRSLRISRKAAYEILDGDGTLWLSGNSKTVDVSTLKEGEYFIFFGDLSFKFIKHN
ncbi:MAG: hypothetical protein MK212_21545 [Saprospiraceae bacterium]|nr:hypothetical protein [Saprospiraceae bacterium]